MKTTKFKPEWSLLQNQYDSYEKHCLSLQLLSVIILSAAELYGSVNPFIISILLVLWLQDGIWKTYQSRIEFRLLQIEEYTLIDSDESVFQFNSQFQKIRLSGLSLIGEYLRQ